MFFPMVGTSERVCARGFPLISPATLWHRRKRTILRQSPSPTLCVFSFLPLKLNSTKVTLLRYVHTIFPSSAKVNFRTGTTIKRHGGKFINNLRCFFAPPTFDGKFILIKFNFSRFLTSQGTIFKIFSRLVNQAALHRKQNNPRGRKI